MDCSSRNAPQPEEHFYLISANHGVYRSAGYSLEMDYSQVSDGYMHVTTSDGTPILFLLLFDGSGDDSQVLSDNLVQLSKKWILRQVIACAAPGYIAQVLPPLVAFLQKSVNTDSDFSGMVSTCNITVIIESLNIAVVAHLGDSPTIIINKCTGVIIAETIDDNGQSPRADEILATRQVVYNHPYFCEVGTDAKGNLVPTGSHNMSCALISGPNSHKESWLTTPVIRIFAIPPGHSLLALSDGPFEYWRMFLTKNVDGYARKNTFMGDKVLGLNRLASGIKHCALNNITDPEAILRYLHEQHLAHATQIHADYLATLTSEEIESLVAAGLNTPELFRLQFNCQADNRTMILFSINEVADDMDVTDAIAVVDITDAMDAIAVVDVTDAMDAMAVSDVDAMGAIAIADTNK